MQQLLIIIFSHTVYP